MIPDINGSAAEATAREIDAQAPGKALGLEVDVTAPDPVKRMVESIMDKWGRIDVLVNNAGICPVKPFEDLTVQDWDKVMVINIKACSSVARL